MSGVLKPLNSLNDAQRQAVTTINGPVLVLAGPGSGKTRVLTHRIAYLIENGIPPYSIMAVTFTNKAAGEMRERVMTMLGEDKVKGLSLGTFHATCVRILRQQADHIPYNSSFTIYDTSDQLALIKQVLASMRIDIKTHRPWNVLGGISDAKNDLIPPDEYEPAGYKQEIIQEAYQHYQQRLRQANAMDFDDLIMQAVVLLRDKPEVREKYNRRYQYLLVDEFQDTNMAQYELTRLLGGESHNVFVVGDPDQSIYAFRGADYRNVKRFQEDHKDKGLTTIALEENYRSHQLILDTAKAIIRKDPHHIPRDLYSNRKKGEKIEVHEVPTQDREGVFVVRTIKNLIGKKSKLLDRKYNAGDFAVMYRTNAQSRPVEEAFVQHNLPYQLVGGYRFYDRREVRDVVSYMRLIHNPRDMVALDRIINVPARKIGKKTQEYLMAWASNNPEGQWGVLQAILKGNNGQLSARAAGAVRGFAQLLTDWIALRDDESKTPLNILDDVLQKTDYRGYLAQSSKDKEEENERTGNIEQLRAVFGQHAGQSLAETLEHISLIADIDTMDEEKEASTLLTLHSAKGLEFPVVFIVGVNEKMLPHQFSMNSDDELAEERRLFYVGITRAKERLYVTYNNVYFGRFGEEDNIPSRFLFDLPGESTLRNMPSWSHHFQDEGSITAGQKSALDNVEPLFAPGMQVNHRIFGEGMVLESRHAFDIEEVTVEFNDYGTKKLDAAFLIPVEGAANLRFQPGNQVMHRIFGEGTVIRSTIDSGDEFVTVKFRKGQEKTLDGKFLTLIE